MFPVRIRERLMDSAYPARFMLCASSLLDGTKSDSSRLVSDLPGTAPWPQLAMLRSDPYVHCRHVRSPKNVLSALENEESVSADL